MRTDVSMIALDAIKDEKTKTVNATIARVATKVKPANG